jgi:hypothetical protein
MVSREKEGFREQAKKDMSPRFFSIFLSSMPVSRWGTLTAPPTPPLSASIMLRMKERYSLRESFVFVCSA